MSDLSMRRTNPPGPADRADLGDLARDVDACCRLRGDFVLRSGARSEEYFDKYLFESEPVLLARVTAAMVPLLPPETTLLGGLELGGVPLATALSARTRIRTLFVRRAAKTYGTCRLAEGGDPAGATVVLVEDVISTGGAVINAARALRAEGARVALVACAIDRRDGARGANRLAEEGIEVRSALTSADLGRAHAG